MVSHFKVDHVKAFSSKRALSLAGLSLVACLAMSLLTSCRHNQSPCGPAGCEDIPKGAVPQALGTAACLWQPEQAGRAEQDDFVIYRYQWRGESPELSPFGQRHVKVIAKRLPDVPFPVVVEPSGDDELDQKRVAWVSMRLAELQPGFASNRVILGRGIAEGLDAAEAGTVSQGYLGGAGAGRGASSFGGGFRGSFRGALGGGLSAF